MRRIPLPALVLAALWSQGARAAEPGVGAGLQASTLGLGGELQAMVTPELGFRLGGNALSLSPRRSVEGVGYDTEVMLASGGGVVDWYPFAGSFRLSVGLRANGNGIDLSASPAQPVTLGDTTYAPGQVGRLQGEVRFAPVAPYLGLGWQSGLMDGKLSVGLDLGVLYQGSPDVSLRANGSLAGNGAFEADLDRQRRAVADAYEPLRFFPVVALSLTYRF